MNGSTITALDWNLVQSFLAVAEHGSRGRPRPRARASPRWAGRSPRWKTRCRPLRQRHPEIQIELVANNTQDDLLDRQTDIALRMVQPSQDSVLARSLGAVPMGAWASRAYLAAALTNDGTSAARANDQPGASAGPLTPAALQRLAWIGEDQGRFILSGMAQRNPGMTRERFAVRSDHAATRWQAVLQGLGVGFELDALAARHPDLVRVLPRSWVPPLPLWLTAAPELRRNARFRAVFDHLAEALPPLLAVSPPDDGPAFFGPPSGAT